MRAMLQRTLSLSGLELSDCAMVENGAQALELLRQRWFDLVLTDINMPVMDGMELVHRMAGDDVLRSVPVVVISTEGSQQRIDDLQRNGIRGYIRKPFTPEQVKELVEGVLAPAA